MKNEMCIYKTTRENYIQILFYFLCLKLFFTNLIVFTEMEVLWYSKDNYIKVKGKK